ncbi:MAG: hypothetical protein Q8906_15820 [Bacillota bacterium]|nr:hypothetical protein [Bacillota bacterium]
MKENRRIFIPAILAVGIGVALVIYSVFFMQSGGQHHGPPPGGGLRHFRRRDGGGFGGLIKQLGTIIIICGAINYSWFYLKRRMKSPLTWVKKTGKYFYKVHTYVGWIALGLTAVHGTYYLLKDFKNPATFTGLAAFVLLLALALYGLFVNRSRVKSIRKIHFLLTNVWLILLLIHAGGHFILPAAITLLSWGSIALMERMAKQTVTA